MERMRMRDTAWLGYTDWLKPQRVAAELGADYHRVLEWIKRKEDPLPAVKLDGNRRTMHVNREELNKWLERNSTAIN